MGGHGLAVFGDGALGAARRAAAVCGEHPRLVAGMTSLFLWVWIVLQGSFFYADPVGIWAESGYPWAYAMVVFAVVFASLGLGSRWVKYELHNDRVLAAVLALLMAGIALAGWSCHVEVAGPVAIGLMMAGSALVGAATPVYYLSFIRMLLDLRVSQIIVVCSSGTVLACLLNTALSVAPQAVQFAGSAALPLCMFAVLWPQRKPGTAVVEPAKRERLYIPWKLNLTAFAQGLGYQAGLAACVQLNGAPTPEHGLVYMLGFALAACVLGLFTPVSGRNFDTLIYKVGFPVLALGTILMPVLSSTGLSCLLAAWGYRFVDILIWSLVMYLTLSKRVTVDWMAGWSTCFFYLGMATGYVWVKALLGVLGPGSEQLVVALVGFLVTTTALMATSVTNADEAWGLLGPAPQDRRPHFAEALDRLAAGWGLTNRQVVVAGKLALGESKSEIADSLGISRETVKVHTRNIYAAAGVHSQEELARLVADREEEIRAELM